MTRGGADETRDTTVETALQLAVVIVSFNVRELLRACLASLYADASQLADVEMQVLVVDNASEDGSASMVAAAFPQAELIASDQNLGFAGGNNRALRRLGFGQPLDSDRLPDAVLLLNPDTEVQPGALGTLCGFLQRTPRTGGCCPSLNYGDGRFQHSAFRFPGLLQLLFDLFPPTLPGLRRLRDSHFNGRYSRRLYEDGQPFAIDFALGAALLVRAQAVADAGLLDEGYFMYAEEMDWCRRLQAAGWPLYCVPVARVTHHEGRSTRQFRGAMLVALWRSRLRYYDTYYPAWKRWLARRLLAAGMAAAARRARAAHAGAEIDTGELETRLDAYDQVLGLL